MKTIRVLTTIISILAIAALFTALPADAQYSNYGGGYNNYGGGGYNNRMGGFGGQSGYNSYSGGYNNRMGGGMGSSMGGFGSRMGGMGGMSGMSGRSSRRGSSRSNYQQQGYGGNTGYGNTGSSRRGGRSSRGNTGRNYSSGGVPQSAQGQVAPGQTSSKGMSVDRRRALSGGGKSPAKGGGIQVGGSQGTLRVPGAPDLSKLKRNMPGKTPSRRKQPEIKMRPVANFYLDTPTTMVVVNEPFPISVVLSNNPKLDFDRIAFTLKYDPADIMPVADQNATNDWQPITEIPFDSTPDEKEKTTAKTAAVKTAASTTKEPDVKPVRTHFSFITNESKFEITQNSIDAQAGLIRFEARTSEGSSAKNTGEITQIAFMPLREARTKISFIFYEGDPEETEAPLTALSHTGLDSLGSRFKDTDGVINLDMEIFETLDKIKERPVITKAGDRKRNRSQVEDEGTYLTHLYLIPRQKTVDVGDVVEVDVFLENPEGDTIDTVNLLIAYNSRIFKPVDGDDFSPGFNFLDKPYSKKFPFDFPVLNTIDSEKGIADYRKKGFQKKIRSEGVIATLKLQAVRPTTKTTFRVFLNESGEEPTTGVFYRYHDRLGDPVDPFDGVTTCSLKVRPTTAYLKKYANLGEG